MGNYDFPVINNLLAALAVWNLSSIFMKVHIYIGCVAQVDCNWQCPSSIASVLMVYMDTALGRCVWILYVMINIFLLVHYVCGHDIHVLHCVCGHHICVLHWAVLTHVVIFRTCGERAGSLSFRQWRVGSWDLMAGHVSAGTRWTGRWWSNAVWGPGERCWIFIIYWLTQSVTYQSSNSVVTSLYSTCVVLHHMFFLARCYRMMLTKCKRTRVCLWSRFGITESNK